MVFSLVTFALEVGLIDRIEEGANNYAVPGMILILIFGFVPAAVIGSIGAVVVHFVTRRASSQWPAVLVATIVGFLSLIVMSGGDSRGLGLSALVGVGAGVGRWAVVPIAVLRGP